jgi:predicted lipid-binding transport protein (Tim44 family)
LSLEISEREQAGHVLHSELVKFVAAELLEPEEPSKLRGIEMRCISRMIVALQDADGCILAGDPDHVRCLSEVWTLERPAGSSGWVVTSIEEDE